MSQNTALHKTIETEEKKSVIVEKNKGLSVIWAYAVFVSMSFVLTGLIIYWNSQIIEKKYEITSYQKTQRQLIKKNEKLKMQVSELSSLSRIEKIAREKLGMVSYPSSIHHIHELN